jgi:WD40 repeat protein
LKVIVGTANRSIGVLDVASHQYSTLVRSHTDTIHSLAICDRPVSGHVSGPRDTFDITTVSSDCTIRVWDVKSAEQRFQFDAPGEVARCVVYRPVKESSEGSEHCAQDEIACGFESGCVRIFDIPSTSTLCEHTQHQGAVVQLLYSHDGSLLYSAGQDGQLCVYDVQRQYQPVRVLSADALAFDKAATAHLFSSIHLALSPDGRLLAVAGLEDGCVQLLWADSLHIANPNGLRIPIRLASSGKSAAAISRAFTAMCFSPDGSELIAISTAQKLLRFQQLGETNQAVPFSRYKYSATPPISSAPVHALTVSPNGKYIVTAGADCCVRVWGYNHAGAEASGPPPLPAFQIFSAHSAEINAVSFTPDGRRLVSVSTDSCILVWQFLGDCSSAAGQAMAVAQAEQDKRLERHTVCAPQVPPVPPGVPREETVLREETEKEQARQEEEDEQVNQENARQQEKLVWQEEQQVASYGLELETIMSSSMPEAPPAPTARQFQEDLKSPMGSNESEPQAGQERIEELELVLQRAMHSEDQARSGLMALVADGAAARETEHM